MKTNKIACLLAALALSFLMPTTVFAQRTRTIQIAAAANLTKVFDEQLIPLFMKETNIGVVPTYGSTGLLAKQMENGAPFEVFVAADVKTVNKLAGENILDPKSVQTYAVGQLALWSKTLPVDSKGLAIVNSSDVTNIAVANPATAPYGAAAMETLNNLKIESQIDSKIVYAENISQALQYAQSDNADVAFTALSLVIDETEGAYFIVPAKFHTPIAQAFGIVPKPTGLARRFARFLMSKEAQKILQASGYLAPPPPSAK